jgi:hypothetical protein
VVLFFGLGEQVWFCGLASFSQAAMLAYLQLSPPLADVVTQNAALPTCCGAAVPLFIPLEDDEPICAWASETPAARAAIAVNIVKDFMDWLLWAGVGADDTTNQREPRTGVPGTRAISQKSFTRNGREKSSRPSAFNPYRELSLDNEHDLM